MSYFSTLATLLLLSEAFLNLLLYLSDMILCILLELFVESLLELLLLELFLTNLFPLCILILLHLLNYLQLLVFSVLELALLFTIELEVALRL